MYQKNVIATFDASICTCIQETYSQSRSIQAYLQLHQYHIPSLFVKKDNYLYFILLVVNFHLVSVNIDYVKYLLGKHA